ADRGHARAPREREHVRPTRSPCEHERRARVEYGAFPRKELTMRLKDKIALVTGASRGIGYASSLALAKEGATIVGTARNAADLAALEKAVALAGGNAKTFAGDVTKAADV